MKRLFISLFSAASICAHAATNLPIQLISPVGSTSGQAIVSTGASSAPAWTAVVGASSPTITTPNIIGVTNTSNAAAGSVGEVITAQSGAVSLSTSTSTNIISIPLTPGDWDVRGTVEYDPAGTTIFVQSVSGISVTSATLPSSPLKAVSNYPSIAGNQQSSFLPITRVNISSPTTVFVVGFAGFTVSTLTATAYIAARRIR